MLRYACISRLVVFKVLLCDMFNGYTSFEEVLNAKKKIDNKLFTTNTLLLLLLVVVVVVVVVVVFNTTV